MILRTLLAGFLISSCSVVYSGSIPPPLLPEATVKALAEELSGIIAKRNLEYLARHHRMRGSVGFRLAAEHIAEQLRAYGLSDVRVEQIPADGKTFYGTQKARPAWDAEFAELWEMEKNNDKWVRHHRLASWDAMPITLAQDSESADVEAELIDVGDGTRDSDYNGKDVRGKLVLAASQPGPVARLAVEKYGAVGIISYVQNQRTAWWGEDENLVRWGHLGSFSETKTFAFMVSLKQARAFQEQLARGDMVRLQATVRAGKHEGFYNVVTAVIPGDDPSLRDEEIAYSCHLDHQLPGANDNASGSVTILEIARTFAKLIREEKIARPARTLRFIWPPEIEGTMALLHTRPQLASRIKAVIHMDMVGGGPKTKAIFHVTRGPASVPSVIYDVAAAFGEFVNRQSDAFASGQAVDFPLVSPEGGKEALQARFVDFSMGSDHQIYTEGSYGIPAIYMNDWPDRYIHTNFDTPENIDPTKLKRAAFIGAASGYFLANANSKDAEKLWQIVQKKSLQRSATTVERRAQMSQAEAANLTRFHLWYERAVFASIEQLFKVPDPIKKAADSFFSALLSISGQVQPPLPPQGNGNLVFSRNPEVLGPLSTFGYNYFTDHYGEEQSQEIRVFRFNGLRGSGGAYAYEILNFVDGRRTIQAIRDAVSAEYGPIPIDIVVEYLQALQSIGLVSSGS